MYTYIYIGVVPIIRAPPGGAAEMLSQTVYQSLVEHLNPRGPAGTLFADCLISSGNNSSLGGTNAGENNTSNRPLLLIFDRYLYISIV